MDTRPSDLANWRLRPLAVIIIPQFQHSARRMNRVITNTLQHVTERIRALSGLSAAASFSSRFGITRLSLFLLALTATSIAAITAVFALLKCRVARYATLTAAAIANELLKPTKISQMQISRL